MDPETQRAGTDCSRTLHIYQTQADKIEQAPPLDVSLNHFWGSRDALADYSVRIAEPEVELALLKRIGLPDFVPASTFRGQVERVYEGVTECALKIAFEG